MCWGVPAKVVRVEGLSAEVDFGGVRRQVVVGAEGVEVGDLVVVHAGLIIGKIEEEALAENLKFYRDLLAESLVGEGLPESEAFRRAGEMIKNLFGLEVSDEA